MKSILKTQAFRTCTALTMVVALGGQVMAQEMLQSLSREIDPELQQRHSRVLVQYPCQQWLQINTRVGRNWLTGQKESLIASLSKSQHTPPEKIGQRIDRLVELLRMTDEIFAGVEIQPDHLRFVVGAAVPANAP